MARYEVTVNNPSLAKGAEVEIVGLGILKNGEAKTVSAEEAELFRQMNAGPVVLVDDKDPAAGFTSEQGPTVLQAFEGSETVNVTTVTGSKGGDK